MFGRPLAKLGVFIRLKSRLSFFIFIFFPPKPPDYFFRPYRCIGARARLAPSIRVAAQPRRRSGWIGGGKCHRTPTAALPGAAPVPQGAASTVPVCGAGARSPPSPP